MIHIILLIVSIHFMFGQDKGKSAYNDQRYGDAKKYYQDILSKRKNDNAAKFGLGVTAYKQKDMKTALSFLNAAKNSEDSKLASKAYYNLGNMLREQNKMDESLAFYKKAIELDPSDQDAKINFELLKQAIQEQQDQEQQDQEQRDKKENDGQKTDQQIQAEAILNALKDQEKINQKRQIKKARSRKMDKDW